jgi:hypothetical protein
MIEPPSAGGKKVCRYAAIAVKGVWDLITLAGSGEPSLVAIGFQEKAGWKACPTKASYQ